MLPVYFIIEDMITDTDEQMKRYIGKACKGPKYSSFCPHGVGVCHPPGR